MPTVLEPLAARTEPCPAAADLRLGDRAAAALARLSFAAVDAELRLHPAFAAVGEPVVAERRALASDAELERGADRLVQAANLGGPQRQRRPQRVDLGAPEGLVDVDVPHPGERPLVEERGLHRCAAPAE